MIGWKKVRVKNGRGWIVGEAIAKLEIRGKVNLRGTDCGCVTKKCRCSEAKVLSIKLLWCEASSKSKELVFVSQHNRSFVYKVGRIVRPKGPKFSDSRFACAPGVHFFLKRKDAVEY